jgi:hypothetical protein
MRHHNPEEVMMAYKEDFLLETHVKIPPYEIKFF